MIKKTGRLLTVVLIVIAAVSYLIFSAVTQHSGVEITISDLNGNPDAFIEKYIILEGELDPLTVLWDPDKIELYFTIFDEAGQRLAVLYEGIKPDGFYDDVIAIVNGKYDSELNLFIADTLQTRCPSTYEASEEAAGDSSEAGLNI